MLIYISNSTHYKEVLSRVQNVKHTLWAHPDFSVAHPSDRHSHT